MQGYIYVAVRETRVFRVRNGEEKYDIPPELMDKVLSEQQVGQLLGVEDFDENYWSYIDTESDYCTNPDAEILEYSTQPR